ncbi:MAG: lipoyl synthase [Bacteroidetes bacterium]|nr:lipoyl synthase [Bacteroidota bacterium]
MSNCSYTRQGTRKPEWLKVHVPGFGDYKATHSFVHSKKLHTVCEEAHCPNQAECWAQGTATFLILGDVCTRSCKFCGVKKGSPSPIDIEEPLRIVEAIEQMKVQYIVITSVTRDDLPDGGASLFAQVLQLIHNRVPQCKIEVLIPDFGGLEEALNCVLQARPDVVGHNVETVPRLYPIVRPQAQFYRSLNILKLAKQKGFTTKTGIMVGLGEDNREVLSTMQEIRSVGCDILTIGQYLQPSRTHLPVVRYVQPDEFERWKEIGYAIGFRHVESGPLVRSSYRAARMM